MERRTESTTITRLERWPTRISIRSALLHKLKILFVHLYVNRIIFTRLKDCYTSTCEQYFLLYRVVLTFFLYVPPIQNPVDYNQWSLGLKDLWILIDHLYSGISSCCFLHVYQSQCYRFVFSNDRTSFVMISTVLSPYSLERKNDETNFNHWWCRIYRQ